MDTSGAVAIGAYDDAKAQCQPDGDFNGSVSTDGSGTCDPAGCIGLSNGDAVRFSSSSLTDTVNLVYRSNGSIVLAAPGGHVSGITATPTSASQINLSWTDVASTPGVVVPHGYLVVCSTTNSFADPKDRVAQSDDASCADGAGVQNVSQGVQLATWAGLNNTTTYYFKIFPYTSFATTIDFKTDGSVPETNATTNSPYAIAITKTADGAESNGGMTTAAVFTVTVTPANSSGTDITGDVAYSGAATEGTDYATGTPVFSIPDGQATDTITLSVIEDAEIEGTEDITATISNPSAGSISTSQATANVADDDFAPTVSGISPMSGPEAGGTLVTITGTGFTGATTVHFGSTVLTSGEFNVSSDTEIVVSVPPGIGTVDITVTNASGTSATGAATFEYQGDTTAPTVTVVQASGQADPTSTSPIIFDVIFSEAVMDFDTGDVTLAGTAGATTATVAGMGTNYTVAVSGMTMNGTVIASVLAGAAHDAAGNANMASTGDNTVTYNVADTTAPIVSEVTPVPALANDPAPAYTFASDESGTATFGGDCAGTPPIPVSVGNTTVDFAPLSPGLHSNCTVTVTDGAGNASNVLPVSSFTIDTSGPSVAISAPTVSRGPFTATFSFSEDVSDFDDLADIVVANGTVATIVGGPQVYTATITPESHGTVTIDVPAGIAVDLAGNANTAAAQVSVNYTDPTYVRTRTQRVIANFLSTRADQITAGDPDLVGRLNGGSAAGAGTSPATFTGAGTHNQGQVAFATSLRQFVAAREASKYEKHQELAGMMALGQQSLGDFVDITAGGFDVWMEAKWSYADVDTRESDASLFYLGAEYRLSPDLLLGVMTQFDWTDEEDATQGTAVDGAGWLVGPYMVARLHDNLIFDGRAAWGRSNNNVSAFGTYTDGFDGERWLIKGQLTGNFGYGEWSFAPHVGVIYFEETQEAYNDTLGVDIPQQTVNLGRITFGPKVAYTWTDPSDGSTFAPYVRVKGIWDFEQTETVDLVSGLAVGSDGMRARLEGGISASFAEGWTLRGEGFYDGAGASDFDAYGGSITAAVPLN